MAFGRSDVTKPWPRLTRCPVNTDSKHSCSLRRRQTLSHVAGKHCQSRLKNIDKPLFTASKSTRPLLNRSALCIRATTPAMLLDEDPATVRPSTQTVHQIAVSVVNILTIVADSSHPDKLQYRTRQVSTCTRQRLPHYTTAVANSADTRCGNSSPKTVAKSGDSE